MKKICLIMLNIRTAQDYRKNLYSIFGNSVTIDILSFNDYSKEKVSDVDLFLLHNNYLLKEVDFPLELPMGVPVVDIRLDFNYRSLQILEEFPQGTRAIYASASEGFTNEGLSRLLQIGMDNIEWIPFSSSRSWYSDVDVLITPGEPQILPDELKSRYPLVDIGARSLAPHVIDEIIEGLNLEFVRNWSNYKDYVTPFPLRNQRDNDLIDTSLEVRQGIEALSEILDEGVVTVNEFGKIISFNQKAAEALKVVADDVIGKTAWDFSEEIFGGLKDFKDTGAIPMHREISRGKERLDFHFHPLIKEGVYRGTLILIHVKQNDDPGFRQIMNLGHRGKYRFADIIGDRMRPLVDQAQKMAGIDAAVLITGETGTGKELFASSIHNASPRSRYPFVAVNCSSLPESLMESELFGYEEGSFTGARKNGRVGLFELANGGTLFLDEIEVMSSHMQCSILRALQEHEIMRLGGNRLLPVNVRVIACSNVDLQELVHRGEFRKDLYYRLSALQLRLPPLRSRGDDVLQLAEHRIRAEGYHYILSDELKQMFTRLCWDGNVRQLYNCLDFFCCLGKPVIEADDYPYEPELKEPVGETAPEDFILRLLYRAFREHLNLGRKGIAREAENKGQFLTEAQIRRILKQLEERGMVAVNKGRGGSRITEKGIRYCEEHSAGS